MIDPNAVTDPARTGPQLEEFLLFCIVVAGKNADQQARKLEGFLGGREPFRFIRSLKAAGELESHLRRVKLGKYTLLGESFRQLARADPDLRTCPWIELTRFPGIGFKTAKFFALHSRPDQMHGVLDTHVLSWMREHWARHGPRRLPGAQAFAAEPGQLCLLGDGLFRADDGAASSDLRRRGPAHQLGPG